ncbi:MAG: amidohydrolase family protein [Firmicutes bacterium]|nr:amidohydrolase family protein [Bacillota bacterium]
MLDILIKNGSYPVYDENVLVKGNIGIEFGKIAYIGDEEPEAAKVIDAAGRVVSPGFIDIHMHEENFSKGKEYCIANMMLKQGVTLAVGGNCGVMNQTVREFRDTIDELGGAPINYMMLSGYNNYWVKEGLGHFDKSTPEQRKAIHEKIKEDLEAGACGISFGIEYDPGMTTEEIIEAAGVSDDEHLLVAAHYRADGERSLEAIAEMIEVQKNINKKFQISHLSSCSAMGTMEKSLDMINRYMEEDPRLNYDTYPYNAFSTNIGSTVFDPGCLEGWKKDYCDLLLTDDPYKNQFATKETFDDCRANHPEMLVVAFVMNEDEIAAAISNPNGMVASDGIIAHGNGHPRAAGTFTRVLGKYVREDKVVDLTTALRKITLEPAKRLEIENRKGDIHVGADADITIFDPETIIDGPSFQDISLPNKGIDYVIVNGEIALKDNEFIDDRAGEFIAYQDK